MKEIKIKKNHSKENVDFWQKKREEENKVNVYIGVKPNPLDSTKSR